MLVTYDASTTLEELARVADMLLDYNGTNQSVSMVNEEKRGGASRQSRFEQCDNSRSQSGRGSDTRNYFSNSGDLSLQSIPLGIRAFHPSQKPKVCRYHLYFGKNAKACKKWCILSSSANL